MRNDGFTLAELLVATAVALLVCGVALAGLQPARAALGRETSASEVSQRLRTGLQRVADELRLAGAGPIVIEGTRLGDLIPVLLPSRGIMAGSDATVFDEVRLVGVDERAAQGVLREPSEGALLRLHPPPACPSMRPACGFVAGDRALLITDDTHHAFVEIDAVGAADAVVFLKAPPGRTYPAGSVLAAVAVTTLRRTEEVDGTGRVSRGATEDVMPLIDHVTDFELRVYGDAAPPRVTGVGRLTTYGPPAPTVGENCVFVRDDDGALQPRLPRLGLDGQVVPLTPAMFGDGPWCPGPGHPSAFDADLLRIRRVDVALRVEAEDERVRGPAGPWFRRPGRAAQPSAWVPDGAWRTSVTPRNLQPR